MVPSAHVSERLALAWRQRMPQVRQIRIGVEIDRGDYGHVLAHRVADHAVGELGVDVGAELPGRLVVLAVGGREEPGQHRVVGLCLERRVTHDATQRGRLHAGDREPFAPHALP